MSWNGFIKQKLKQRKYVHCKRTKKDIIHALNAYKDLGVNECIYNEDAFVETTRTLVCLTGTICVSFDSHVASYMSIRVVVMKRYPDVPPAVYIIPTSGLPENLRAGPNRFVDSEGKCCLPVIKGWERATKPNIVKVLDQLRKLLAIENCSVPKPLTAINENRPKISGNLTDKRAPTRERVTHVRAIKQPSVWDAFINQTLNARKYNNRIEVKQHVINALDTFVQLKPCTGDYVTDEGVKLRDLLCVTGALPVPGCPVDIPVEIWIPPEYPDTEPVVFVNPSHGLSLQPTRNVDINGKVTSHMLSSWSHVAGHDCDLVSLIDELTATFGKELPIIPRSSETVYQRSSNHPIATAPLKLYPDLSEMNENDANTHAHVQENYRKTSNPVYPGGSYNMYSRTNNQGFTHYNINDHIQASYDYQRVNTPYLPPHCPCNHDNYNNTNYRGFRGTQGQGNPAGVRFRDVDNEAVQLTMNMKISRAELESALN